ncbi:hypothetical protein M4I32_13100 [Microbacterium sp. LRZ72]|uniref:hypothetical protein n=1 Tax=Microbacterium sp. LRZ72 TaxID=2942481 RepID=UPI0029BDB6C9|nr:hypothetical protein [Microbacterium sp. LRZ72]MDX2377740.1 hypothetical protein [Microbacterium sp. LRZ72]
MKLAAPSRPSKTLYERLLITKIITGLGLAFVLVSGIWSAAHSEPGGVSSILAPVVTASADAAAAMGSVEPVAAVSQATTPGAPDRAEVGADNSSGMMAGVAGCLLGIFCSLLLLVVKRLYALRVTPRVVAVGSRASAPMRAVARRFTPTLTLVQLSLSRV